MDENVPARATRQEVGAFGEGVAARYLADRGLEIIDRNWRCRLGEIDLVARRRVRAGVLRGQDAKLAGGGGPTRGGDPAQGGPAARPRPRMGPTASRRAPPEAAGRRRGRAVAAPWSQPGASRGRGDPMTVGATRSIALHGLDGRVVDVEAHLSNALPALIVSGLPDAACRQAPERVRSAVASSDVGLPPMKIVVNLSPGGAAQTGDRLRSRHRGRHPRGHRRGGRVGLPVGGAPG